MYFTPAPNCAGPEARCSDGGAGRWRWRFRHARCPIATPGSVDRITIIEEPAGFQQRLVRATKVDARPVRSGGNR